MAGKQREKGPSLLHVTGSTCGWTECRLCWLTGTNRLRGENHLKRKLNILRLYTGQAGWPTSTGPNGEVLVIPKGRLESLSRDLVWVPGQNLWPLIRFNPGLYLAFLRVITPWGNISTYWGCLTATCGGSAGWERKLRLTFFECARLWPHSDICTWAAFSWSRRILGV